MHRRRTPKTLSKPPPIQGPPKKTIPQTEPAQESTPSTPDGVQFELELCWCVQQLQDALNGGKLSQKLAEDTAKNLKILTSATAPLIRKRQVMKQSMGDYRAKMQQEEKKLMLASKQVKFTPAPAATKKSSFVKKSALLTTGKDFRFDFALPAAAAATDTNENSGVSASQPVQASSLPQSSAGTPFKFNFTIEEESANNLNLSGLMLT